MTFCSILRTLHTHMLMLCLIHYSGLPLSVKAHQSWHFQIILATFAVSKKIKNTSHAFQTVVVNQRDKAEASGAKAEETRL